VKSSNRTVVVLTGVLAGAFLGGIFAWMASKREGDGEESAAVALGPSDYFQLGISVLTLARQFGAMLNKG